MKKIIMGVTTLLLMVTMNLWATVSGAITQENTLPVNALSGHILGTALATSSEEGYTVKYTINVGDNSDTALVDVDVDTGVITLNTDLADGLNGEDISFTVGADFYIRIIAREYDTEGTYTNQLDFMLSTWIIEAAPNADPVISGDPATTVDVDATYDFTPSVTDEDSNVSATGAFSISVTPSWAEFNANTGQLIGSPEVQHIGTTSNIVITVTDDEGASDVLESFDIEVVAIAVAFTASTVPNFDNDEENGYEVGTVTASGGTTLQFFEVETQDFATFSISTGGVITVQDNTPFLSQVGTSEYLYNIEVFNAEGGTDTVQVSISVDLAPVALALDTSDVNLQEGQGGGMVVIDLDTIASGGTAPYIWALTDTSNTFALIGSELLIFTPSNIDFEDVDGSNSFTIQLTLTDDDSTVVGPSDIVITITNLNEVTLDADQTRTVNEIQTSGDIGDPYTYTAEDEENLSFELTETQEQPISIDNVGQLSIDGAADVGSHLITVVITDNSSGESAEETFTLEVEAEVISGNLIDDQTTSEVSELHEVGPTTATVLATTTDVTFAIEDNVYFSIDASTGVLSVKDTSDLDFEENETIVLQVTASKADEEDDTAEVTIPVGDIDDNGTVSIDEQEFQIYENSSYGTLVGTVTVDATFSDNLEYEIDSSVFAINSQGQIYVGFGAVLDYETQIEYDIEVTVTDNISGATAIAEMAIDLFDQAEDGTTEIVDQTFNLEEFTEEGETGIFITALGDNLEYTIETADTPFQINTETGEIIILESGVDELDLDVNTEFTLQVSVTNPENETMDTATITLVLVEEGDAPDYFLSEGTTDVLYKKKDGGCLVSTGQSAGALWAAIVGLMAFLMLGCRTPQKS